MATTMSSLGDDVAPGERAGGRGREGLGKKRDRRVMVIYSAVRAGGGSGDGRSNEFRRSFLHSLIELHRCDAMVVGRTEPQNSSFFFTENWRQ